MVLIVVTGPPCSGKTVLAQKIAQEFSIAIFHKDGIKELLFGRLGWKDRVWSRQLSLVSYDLIYYFIESELSAGQSCIVEANFQPEEHRDKFRTLVGHYACQIVQVLCFSEGSVLWKRLQK
jgi:predicted kinase